MFLASLVPNLLVVHPSVEAKTVADVIELAKATPGGLDFASSGNGTRAAPVLEMFRCMTGIKLNHIPYRGGGLALNDVISGQVKYFFSNGVVVGRPCAERRGQGDRPYRQGPAEHAARPAGGVRDPGGFEAYEWNGVFVPAGTPAEIMPSSMPASTPRCASRTSSAGSAAQRRFPREHPGRVPGLRGGGDGEVGPGGARGEDQAGVRRPAVGWAMEPFAPTLRRARGPHPTRAVFWWAKSGAGAAVPAVDGTGRAISAHPTVPHAQGLITRTGGAWRRSVPGQAFYSAWPLHRRPCMSPRNGQRWRWR